MKASETKVIERPLKTDFIKWFKTRYWEIAGKFALPTQEELEELATESWRKYN